VYFWALERAIDYHEYVRLRYSYRLYPDAVQRAALARAFGCARVVFNDALAARRAAHAAGEPYISDGVTSARLTASKQTPERAWLGEVSSVVLQQALAVHDRDVNAAKNILALGRRERLNARGGQVRPAATLAPAEEAGSHRDAA
jgi:transposase